MRAARASLRIGAPGGGSRVLERPRLLPLALVSLVLSSLVLPSRNARAQTGDPDELLRLQRVLRTAIARVAPSMVRVETFGGVRRTLERDIGSADSVAGGRPARPSDVLLPRLFEKLDRADFERLGTDPGWKPKDPAKPTWQDLRDVDPALLDELFDKHGIRPDEPGEGRPQDRPRPRGGLGPLVQPGFLQAQGATTGLVLSADGWIAISRFALNYDPTTILVTLADGRSFTAARFGEDTSRGIALVKIDATDLPVAEIADAQQARTGQWAFALGRTFGSGDSPSVHMGIVSAVGRQFGRALQIDAYTSPANYGGPVVDVRGRVLGIAVPLSPSGRNAGVDWYDSGIGFAVTLAGIEPLLARMRAGETLHRGWLGVGLDGSHLGPGARLVSIVEPSPAHGAGLQNGDVVVAIDGVGVANSFHLQSLVSSRMAADRLRVDFRRGDDVASMTLVLGDVPIAEREEKTRKEETFTLPWEDGDPAEGDRGR